MVKEEITLIGMDDTYSMFENPVFFDMQKEAVELYCHAKLRSNPKTTLGFSLMHPDCFDLISKPSSDIDVLLYCVQGQRPGCGPPCSDKPGMESLGSWLKDEGRAVDVVWFPDMDPISNKKHLFTTPLKKERLEAFVAAANKNNNSHIAYLEPGCDVRQVLTESGILTPRRLSNKDKEKAAVIDGPENVIPMKMKNHHQTSSSGLAPEDETASDVPENVITNNNDNKNKNKNKNNNNNNQPENVIPNTNNKKKKKKKKNKNNNNQPLVHSQPQKANKNNDNMSHKGKNQVC